MATLKQFPADGPSGRARPIKTLADAKFVSAGSEGPSGKPRTAFKLSIVECDTKGEIANSFYLRFDRETAERIVRQLTSSLAYTGTND